MPGVFQRQIVATLALVASACGAKTGLEVPDVADVSHMDAGFDVIDAFDAPRCIQGQFALTARSADVILVIDRSGSMDEGLDGMRAPPGMSKWSLLRDALSVTLPVFQDRINDGALFYPQTGGTGDSWCVLATIPDVDVDPASGNAPRVLDIINSTGPAGSTPTAAALLRAYQWFVRNPNRARSRYLVLATDGGPNCNALLDPSTCVCASNGLAMGRCGRRADGIGCLDDLRTIAEIHQIATNPIAAIPTYVIGLAGDATPVFASTLTAMAIAGGRPNISATGTPTFFNVAQAGDLPAAFTTIQNAIARCSFVTPSQPTTADGISIALDGTTIPRDETRMNGWDWTDRAFGEITLFGAACAQAAVGTPAVVATVLTCDSGG